MKIGILISGRGSNMVALVDAVNSGDIPTSEVVVVISDKVDAAGLAKAKERSVETVVVERKGRTRRSRVRPRRAPGKARQLPEKTDVQASKWSFTSRSPQSCFQATTPNIREWGLGARG